MTAASLNQGNKPRQSLYLSDETVRVRDALIDKFSDKSLEELNDFISKALETEQDEAKRLGVLAARLYILRVRIGNLSAFNNDPTMTDIPSLTTRDLMGDRPEPAEVEDIEAVDDEFDPDNFDEWTELRIIEDGEVNGVRFPKDAIITVGPFDAYRLLKTGHAAYATPAETTDETSQSDGDATDIEQIDEELSMLSSDDEDISAEIESERAADEMVDAASAEDTPSIEADASDDDMTDDVTTDDEPSDDDTGTEEGIDPFANR